MGKHRSEKNRARNGARHPAETLAFFGLRDDMNVIELYPGEGWYTEILAPVLRAKGKLTVTSRDPATAKGEQRDDAIALDAKLKGAPEVYGKVQVQLLDPPKGLSFGPDNSADLVLTFRNVHNFYGAGHGDKLFAAAFKVLKSGGTLGLTDHRASTDLDPKASSDTGYISEATVVALATAAGFKLAGRSEVNANAKDTKDYPGGVWTLPPTFARGAQDREKYAAIGESDRMTLKFTKP